MPTTSKNSGRKKAMLGNHLGEIALRAQKLLKMSISAQNYHVKT